MPRQILLICGLALAMHDARAQTEAPRPLPGTTAPAPLFPHPRLEAGQQVFTNASWVHLRAGPSGDATVLDDVPIETKLTVLPFSESCDDKAADADCQWGEEGGWVAVALWPVRAVQVDTRSASAKAPVAACPVITAGTPRPRARAGRAFVSSELVSADDPDSDEIAARAEEAMKQGDTDLAFRLLERATVLAPSDADLQKTFLDLAQKRGVTPTPRQNVLDGRIAIGCRGDRARAIWVEHEADAVGKPNVCLAAPALKPVCTPEYYAGVCDDAECFGDGAIDEPPDPARDAEERACFARREKGAARRQKQGKAARARDLDTRQRELADLRRAFPDGPWARLVIHGISDDPQDRFFLVVSHGLACDEDACFQEDHWKLDGRTVCEAGRAPQSGETLVVWARLASVDATALSVRDDAVGGLDQYATYFGKHSGGPPESESSILAGRTVSTPMICRTSDCPADGMSECGCSAD